MPRMRENIGGRNKEIEMCNILMNELFCHRKYFLIDKTDTIKCACGNCFSVSSIDIDRLDNITEGRHLYSICPLCKRRVEIKST